jgi:endonuclease/exonuclease/phosphatase family metal-dependent hydrolase
VGPLRIVTINTGKCDGSYRRRVEWLALELERLDPDIVVCQEAFRSESGALDTVEVISRRLGLSVAWSPARFKKRVCEDQALLGWSGMAVLSRAPILDCETVVLPTDERDGERVAQICAIPWEDRDIVVVNLHLTHLRDADGLRRTQLQTLLGHRSFDRPDVVRLICGDFNSPLEGDLIQELLLPAYEGPSIADTYALGNGNGRRATLPPRPESGEPRPCIDFILSVAADARLHPLFASSAVVLDRPEPETGILPSDHYGVATTLLPLTGWRWRNEA